MDAPPELLREAARLWPDLARVHDALDRDPETTLSRAFGEGAAGAKEIVAEEIVGVPSDNLDVAAGKRALEKIRADGPDAVLDPDEIAALELIVNFTARPAILVKDGSFLDPPPPWEDLQRWRPQIEPELRKVGRVQLYGHEKPYAGTAFVVGEKTVLTNRHVAYAFARSDGTDWMLRDGIRASVTFVDDPDHEVPPEFPVERVVAVHPNYDLAVLELAAGPGELPPPMTLATTAPEPHEHRKVYALGYPAPDPRTAPYARARVFGEIYNVKRLQPGEIMRLLPDQGLFYHDCSTLAGNSGSCVVDLETSRVLGVHFNGKYLEYNQAVALWPLKDHPIMRKAGVNVA